MTDRDAFGLPTVPDDENDEFAFLQDAQPAATPETPEGEASPAPAPEGETTEPVAPADTPDPNDPNEVLEPAAPTLYAGRYQTVEELEKGYRELRDMQRRVSERANAYEQQYNTVLAHSQELERSLRQTPAPAPAAPQYETDPLTGEQRQVVAPAPKPEDIQRYVDGLVNERLAAQREELATTFQRQSQAQAAESAVMSFYQAHPEVEPRGNVDGDIAATVQTLNDAWRTTNSAVDISSADSLEIVYEATKRPALRQVLETNPVYFDSDSGMQLARFQASILEGQPITQSSTTVPASAVSQLTSPSKPVVERAGTGTSAGTDAPLDEFDQAVVEYRRGQKRGGGLFFE